MFTGKQQNVFYWCRKRQSVTGLSLDFVVVNVLGFVCYAIFNCFLYFDKHVQAAYR